MLTSNMAILFLACIISALVVVSIIIAVDVYRENKQIFGE